jgi:hypothetical protein
MGASELASARALGCPCCGGVLSSFSPQGRGIAACDPCKLWWESPQDLRAHHREVKRKAQEKRAASPG